MNKLLAGTNEGAKIIFQNNKAKGFWNKELNIGERLMLVTSELGEALEAHRKNRFADFSDFEDTPESFAKHIKDTFEDELADTIIRLLDLCGGLEIDIEKHINLKLEYNKTRPYLHGKQY